MSTKGEKPRGPPPDYSKGGKPPPDYNGGANPVGSSIPQPQHQDYYPPQGGAPPHQGFQLPAGQTMPHHQPHGGQPQVSQPHHGSNMVAPSTMVIIDRDAGASSTKSYPQNKRQWTTGLCDCFSDCGTCCLGMVCISILQYGLANKMRENCCVPVCCGTCGLWAMRAKLRGAHGIQGDLCNDFLATWCCYPLALCQMTRELNNVGY